MSRSRRRFPVSRSTGLALTIALLGAAPSSAVGVPEPLRPLQAARGALRWVPNRGQLDRRVAFVALGGPTRAWLSRDGWTLRLERGTGEGTVVRMRFTGASSAARLEPEEPRATREHFLLGNDPRRWARRVPSFAAVRYTELYPGIGVRVRRGAKREDLFAYDLELAPRADLEQVRVRCEGVERLRLGAGGRLVMTVRLPGGERTELTQRPPESWVEGPGGRRPVASRFRLLSADTYGFAVDGPVGDGTLVVDPTLVWATYLGGAGSEDARVVARAPDGGLLIGGWTGSVDFPTTAGAYRREGGRDAFVALLNAAGDRLVWSTYLGGDADGEEIRALAVHPTSGAVVVGGFTSSPDFPTTPGAFQRAYYGGSVLGAIGDGFVSELSADGSELVFSTFLGRVGDDFVEAVHVARDGVVTVAGFTDAAEFPTTAGVLQPEFRSLSVLVPDGFVTRLLPDGSDLVWSTFFGGAAQDLILDLHVADDGACTIAGLSASDDLWTTPGAYQTAVRGLWDGFVARLAPDARSLRFSTLFGGDGHDHCRALAVDADGATVVVGQTNNVDEPVFPVVSRSYQIETAGEDDGYAALLSSDGRRLRAATLIGGGLDDVCDVVRIDPLTGDVIVAGRTASDDFPLPTGTPPRTAPRGETDGFVVRFDAQLSVVRDVAFLEGSLRERVADFVIDAADEIVAVGTTFSTDLPVTAGALQTTIGGSSDAFAFRARIEASEERLVVVEAAPAADGAFEAGGSFVGLSPTLRNASSSSLVVDELCVLVAGSGDDARDLVRVGVYRDLDLDGRLDGGDPLIASVAFGGDDELLRIVTPGLVLAPEEATGLLFVVESTASCETGAEFVVVLPVDGLVVRAPPRRSRRVEVGGGPNLQGPTWRCGEQLPPSGDVDGDGAFTVLDARLLVQRIGSHAGDDDDLDGDGRVTLRDVGALIDVVLARGSVFRLPAVVELGGTLTVPGRGLAGEVEAEIAGQSLELLATTDREVVFAVRESLPLGMHPLAIVVSGRALAPIDVEVR